MSLSTTIQAAMDEIVIYDTAATTRIGRALSKSVNLGRMLTNNEYIAATKYDISPMFVDTFYNSLRRGLPIVITIELLKWYGYSGKDYTINREFERLLNRMDSGCLTWSKVPKDSYMAFAKVLNDDEKAHQNHGHVPMVKDDEKAHQLPHLGFVDAAGLIERGGDEVGKNFPTELTGRSKSVFIVAPSTLDKLLMKCATKNGDNVRDQFVTIKSLFFEIGDYQIAYTGMAGRLKMETERLRHEEIIATMNANTARMESKLDTANEALDTANEALEDAAEERGDMTAAIGNLTIDVETRDKRLTVVRPRQGVEATSVKREEILVLLHKKDTRKYRAVKCQRGSKETLVNKAILKGYKRIVETWDNVVNAKELWRRVRKVYAADVEIKGSYATLLYPACTEDDFVNFIDIENDGRLDN